MVAEPHKRVVMSPEEAKELADAYSTLAKVYNRIARTSDEVKPAKSRLRDPNCPKRPLSSYLLFANENREAILSRFPGILPQDVMTKCGQTWTALPEEERKKYQDKANMLKAQYDVDVKKYKAAAIPSDEENERTRANGTKEAAATLNKPGDHSTNDVSDLDPASIQHSKKSRKKHHTEEGVEKRKKKKSSKSSGVADEAPKKKKRAK